MGLADYSYGPVAGFYDELAAAYSLGLIGRSKRFCLEVIGPGDRVLFAGVGRGEEAVLAAKAGAVVEAIDVSPEMLSRFAAHRSDLRGEIVLIEGDVSKHRPDAPYDVVVANYFLNLFESARAGVMLDALVALLRPGGRLVISDFAQPGAGALAQGINAAYYRPVNVIAWALGLCALHPIHDYPGLAAEHGLRVRRVESYPLLPALGRFAPGYVAVVVERIDSKKDMGT